MNNFSSRKSWDTAVKHITRNGLLNDLLTVNQIAMIPRSNISRWKKESDDKYQGSEINDLVKQEIELIKRINQSSKIKRINQAYFKLADTFHEITANSIGIKSLIKKQKELVVNSIEEIKSIIPIDKALKIFNISRSTFENYKSIVIHKCDGSYFNWCTKRFPSQLLSQEVQTIKKYLIDYNYKFWSKSSIYLKALRDEQLHCCMSTFYKYCRLIGFNNPHRKRKSDFYHPIKTKQPNELWCADVTIFKTADNTRNHIHFIIDHYSKMILGYRIERKNSALAIKTMIQNACTKYRPEKIDFLTDGGSENINATVSGFISTSEIPIRHIIAQKDVVFSNSMVEALNKVIKHQFLYPKEIATEKQLANCLDQVVSVYNTVRPQMNLGGNTPKETFYGRSIDISRYTHGFKEQKALRNQLNRKNRCYACN